MATQSINYSFYWVGGIHSAFDRAAEYIPLDIPLIDRKGAKGDSLLHSPSHRTDLRACVPQRSNDINACAKLRYASGTQP